jgi:cell division protein FtsL
MRRIPSKNRNYAIHRERDHDALLRLAALLFCGLIAAGGFVYAAGQHFAAVRIGYQSESLRRVREQLLEERRHLLLEREEATAPGRLEQAARGLGMQPIRASQIVAAKEAPKQGAQSAPAPLNPPAPIPVDEGN